MNISKINLNDLEKKLLKSYDLFICSASYEKRCLSIASNIENIKIDNALILSNIDLNEYIQENSSKLMSYFGDKSKCIEINTSDPIITADNLDMNIAEITESGCVNSILLDITTFTHESLLILFRLLKLRCPNTKITILYANASGYSIGEDFKHKWLSRGIGEVRSVLGYPGKIIPTQKTHLILIVGYEHERAIGLIDALEPNSLALGYGRSGSATTEKDKDANEHYLHLVEQMTSSYEDVIEFEIPCNDPIGTKNEINKQIHNAKGMNILIAPMNNKLSTIGTALASFENDAVQLCYAQALKYNYFNYSTPGKECYILELPSRSNALRWSDPADALRQKYKI